MCKRLLQSLNNAGVTVYYSLKVVCTLNNWLAKLLVAPKLD